MGGIVGVISFQKIFDLCGLKGHIVEKRWGVTLVHGRTECEDSETEFAICPKTSQKKNI